MSKKIVSEMAQPFINAGFRLKSLSWQPVFGQGDGEYPELVLQNGGLTLVSTRDGNFKAIK